FYYCAQLNSFSLLCKKNDLLQTEQLKSFSLLCTSKCVLRLFFRENDLLQTEQLNSFSLLCTILQSYNNTEKHHMCKTTDYNFEEETKLLQVHKP
ncbi:hypothetical protein L9F63_014043, partial [Diploptera punctata]